MKFLKVMISIIIPTLNEENHLQELLKNIKDQNPMDYVKRAGECGKFGILKNVKAYTSVRRFEKENFFRDSLREIQERKLNAGSCRTYPISGNLIDKIFFRIFNLWIVTTQFFYPNASGSYIFCERRLHNKINGFNEKLALSEDMDYVKRAGECGKFGILKNVKAYTSVRRFEKASVRRFEKEGRLNLGVKLLLSAVYRIIFGEINTGIFRYGFRHKKR